MLGRLNHVALAVPDLDGRGAALSRQARRAASRRRRRCPSTASASSSSSCRTRASSCSSRSARIRRSPAFLARNPAGGMHHLCYEVDDIRAARDVCGERARASSATASRRSARTAPGALPHPKDFAGTLIELRRRRRMSLLRSIAIYLRDLVAVPVRRAAVRREEPARDGRRDARNRARRAAQPLSPAAGGRRPRCSRRSSSPASISTSACME